VETWLRVEDEARQRSRGTECDREGDNTRSGGSNGGEEGEGGAESKSARAVSFGAKRRMLLPTRIPRNARVVDAAPLALAHTSRTRCPSFFSPNGQHIPESERRRSRLSSPSSPTPTRYTLHAVATTPLHAESQWRSTDDAPLRLRREVENPLPPLPSDARMDSIGYSDGYSGAISETFENSSVISESLFHAREGSSSLETNVLF